MTSEEKRSTSPCHSDGKNLEIEPDNRQLTDNGQPLSEGAHIPVPYCHDHTPQKTGPDHVRERAAYEEVREKQQGEYTLADYYAWPGEQRVELIDGAIYVLEAPGYVHQRIAGELFFCHKILHPKGRRRLHPSACSCRCPSGLR